MKTSQINALTHRCTEQSLCCSISALHAQEHVLVPKRLKRMIVSDCQHDIHRCSQSSITIAMYQKQANQNVIILRY